ncbi:MAG: hypothetical protein ACKOGA_01870, partial [Planctomycetaceae bacterium]
MDDLFAIGLVLGLILPCLIWGAWRLLQSGMSAGQARPPATHRCPECRLRLVAEGDECPRCGAGGDNTLTPPARALSRLHRNVAWLERRGILPAHISQRLLATLASELQILHVTPPVLPPAAPGPLGLSPATPATAGPLTTTEPGSLGLTAPVSVLHDLPGSTTVVEPLRESRDPQAKVVGPVARVTPPPDPRPAATTTPARSPVADSRSATPESPAVASPTEEPLWLEVVDSETESRTKPLLERVADEHRERPRAQPPAVPSDKGTPVASAKPSAKPEWSDWLLAFMEQRNLNWGELIGGLMILSGSLALVFSFWNEIAGRPLLKFCVFNGFTAGLFAAGRYALSRLQLPSTARALYAIGTLLVPLNLLAMASFSRGDAAT